MILAPTLLLNAGSGAAIVRPTFSRDFAGEKTLNNGTGPAIAFTRASNATFFDASGVLQTASSDTPRFDHDPATAGNPSRGLLIEEARTNSIRNAQGGGATSGVIGSGGALPTNWPASGHNTNGVSTEIVGTGTEDGLAYIDLKISGTPTVTTAAFLSFESDAQIAAANGQTWTNSVYIKLVAGSIGTVATATTAVGIFGRDSSSLNVSGQSALAAFTPTTASLKTQRHSVSFTFTSATVARMLPTLRVGYTSGTAFDATIRISSPQAEQGAFATSYIPTTSAAVTRSADSAVVTPISSFYNGTEGTIFNEFSVPVLGGGGTLRGVAQFAEAAAVTNRLQTGFRGTGEYRFDVVAANASEVAIESSAGAVVAGAVVKAAQAYKSGDNARSLNGVSAATSSSAITTPTRERLRFGDNGTSIINGHIRKIAYWPRRLSNALLQSLTT